MRKRGSLLLITLALGLTHPRALAQVRIWEDTLSLPTYEEGDPDVNPPFDLFKTRSFITYPYTTRENLTDRKSKRAWRTLNLENEYLKLVVLPDLGKEAGKQKLKEALLYPDKGMSHYLCREAFKVQF